MIRTISPPASNSSPRHLPSSRFTFVNRGAGLFLYNASMKSRKSWKEKLDNASHAHLTEAPERWVGGAVGKTMLIPSAWELDEIVRKIPTGRTRRMSDIRAEMAKAHDADITCPLTSGIFLRMLAEYAEEQRAAGEKDITPYWRVTDDKGKILPKLALVMAAHHQLPQD